MQPSAFRPLLLLALPMAPAAAWQGSVLVVDQVGGPGSQFTSIVDAVAAAVDGDVILVRPGGYQPFVVDGKALVIEGDTPPGAGPSLIYTDLHPTIRNLPVGESVVLRGFRMDAGLAPALQLEVRDCAGSVLLEDLHLSGGGPCLTVQQCDAVVLARCTFDGKDSVPAGETGAGIEAAGSSLFIYECAISGGAGTDGFFTSWPIAGEDALRIESGLLFASGTVFSGGSGGAGGGPGIFGTCSYGADGGDGLVLGAGAPTATTFDCPLQGGAGGAGFSTLCLAGSSGSPLVVTSGSHTKIPGTHGTVITTSPVREGYASQLVVWGPLGNSVLLLISPAARVHYYAEFPGVLVPDLSLSTLVALGSTPPSGYLAVTFVVGDLPPGVLASGLYLQVAFVDPSMTQVTLGAPSHLLQLDQSL